VNPLSTQGVYRESSLGKPETQEKAALSTLSTPFEGKDDTLCIHEYPSGKGCYFCDPDHPARKGCS
jgi:hypothetical protein